MDVIEDHGVRNGMKDRNGFPVAFAIAMAAATVASISSVWPAIAGSSGPTDDQVREQIRRIVASGENGTGGPADDSASALTVSKAILKGNPAVAAIGPVGAPEVVEFFDYNCGYCRQFTMGVVEPLVQAGRIRTHLVQAPILSPGSRRMALFAAAGMIQGRFQAVHAHLTRQHARTVEEADALVPGLLSYARLDERRFRESLKDGSAERIVKENERLSAEAQITGTPMIYVGGRISRGAMSLEQMEAAIRR